MAVLLHILTLAVAHARHHAARSLTLAIAIALAVAIPWTLATTVEKAQARMTGRADATPLLLGPRTGALDLMVSALYFTDPPAASLTMGAVDAIADSGLAETVPLLLGMRAGDVPVVGVSVDYFEWRALTVAEGTSLRLLGDAVLGAAVARRLGLKPGNGLTTAPRNLFDLAGDYPLRLTIVGVLAPVGGPDDEAVFVDMKTAWLARGIGHGHDPADQDAGMERVAAYRQVTADNLESFHFHGDPASFPVTAALIRPRDDRAGALLLGRFVDPAGRDDLINPGEAMRRLFAAVLEVRKVFEAALALSAASAVLALAVAFYLSAALRSPERRIIGHLGGSPGFAAALLIAEALLLSLFGLVLAEAVRALAAPWLDAAIQRLVLFGVS
jgi:putative ABC transport system permease protein